jgi:hypothetical protein
VSLRDSLPPHLQRLADGPLVPPIEERVEQEAREEFGGGSNAAPALPEPEPLFGTAEDPHTGEVLIRPLHPETFNAAAARAAKEEGMQRADEHAPADWKLRARRTVETLCRSRETFTADDVWGAGLEKPHEPRALGPVMLRARKDGWCEPTGRTVKSRIPEHHQYPMTEYRSLLKPKEATE